LADGSFGKIWKVSLLESEGKTEGALNALAIQWESFLTRIPNERLACQVILRSHRNTKAQLKDYLSYSEATSHSAFAKGKTDHIQNISKDLSLYVTVRYFPQWKNRSDVKQHQNDFTTYATLIEGIFQSAGITFEAMNDEQLTGFLYELLNPSRKNNIPNITFQEDVYIRDQVLYHAPQAQGQGFILENTHTRVISLKELPPTTNIGMFTKEFYEGRRFCLLDIPLDFSLVINFTVPGSNEAMSRLNMQKNLAFMHQDNFLGDKSIEAVEKKKELDETIANMFKGSGKIIHARVHWVLESDDETALNAACHDLISGLSRLDCGGIKEELIAASLYLTCLPLNFDPYFEQFIRRFRRLASGNAADMLPVFGSFSGTKTPAQMYSNRRGQLVYLDFFDSNTNPHAVVIGASGAGKSFFINDFILQNDRLGAHCFVLDKGDSYKKLNRILNGQYISFDLNTPVTINPFSNPPTPENLSFLLSLLSQMASGGDERDRLTREEEGLLHRAVTLAYEHKSSDREVVLSDITAILNDSSFNEKYGINSLMGPTLALRLTPFTAKGPYGGFFDGQNQFKIAQNFTVFELANLSAYPDLQIVVLLNLMFFMTNFVAAEEMRSKRKYLLIDEAWSLLKVKNTADFITNAFKTFRKYRCSVVAITQEIADLTRQESGIAIVANASNKIFLKQEPTIIDMLKDKLSLDGEVIKALKTIETVKGKYSEGFVMTDSSCGVIRLVPDPFLYWAANSEPRNNEYLLKIANQHDGNFIEAIKTCVKEHPYGI
jgi:conjugal transfer ATP-binding protein TraC